MQFYAKVIHGCSREREARGESDSRRLLLGKIAQGYKVRKRHGLWREMMSINAVLYVLRKLHFFVFLCKDTQKTRYTAIRPY